MGLVSSQNEYISAVNDEFWIFYSQEREKSVNLGFFKQNIMLEKKKKLKKYITNSAVIHFYHLQQECVKAVKRKRLDIF